VEHAKNVAHQFRDAGYSAVSLDGGTNREVRRGVVKDFREKRITVLTSVDIFSEGFDCPGVHVGIMLRPTQSEVIYRQQAGRILRPEPGKEYAYIHDHVKNWERFGLPHWDRETPWTLEGEDRKKKPKPPGVKVCTQCFAAMRSGTRKCPECGLISAVKPREIEQRDGELVELTAEEVAKARARRSAGFERSKATTLESMIALGHRKGVKGDVRAWAARVMAARAAKSRR
jgi:DNA repair protein RadD